MVRALRGLEVESESRFALRDRLRCTVGALSQCLNGQNNARNKVILTPERNHTPLLQTTQRQRHRRARKKRVFWRIELTYSDVWRASAKHEIESKIEQDRTKIG